MIEFFFAEKVYVDAIACAVNFVDAAFTTFEIVEGKNIHYKYEYDRSYKKNPQKMESSVSAFRSDYDKWKFHSYTSSVFETYARLMSTVVLSVCINVVRTVHMYEKGMLEVSLPQRHVFFLNALFSFFKSVIRNYEVTDDDKESMGNQIITLADCAVKFVDSMSELVRNRLKKTRKMKSDIVTSMGSDAITFAMIQDPCSQLRRLPKLFEDFKKNIDTVFELDKRTYLARY